MNSHNHIMLGSVDTWFYTTLTGIKSTAPGWSEIRIKPFIPKDMNYAQATLNTIKGVVYTAWERININLKLTVSIPVGCTAEVWIPIQEGNTIISEDDSVIWDSGEKETNQIGISFKSKEEKYIIFSVGSGYYEFYS
jgi:alpha-L-rhamnosidase